MTAKAQTILDAAYLLAAHSDAAADFTAHRARLERAGFDLKGVDLIEAVLIARKMKRERRAA